LLWNVSSKKKEDVFSEGNFVEMGRSYFLVAGGRLSWAGEQPAEGV